MSAPEMVTRDIYLRHTSVDGKSYVQEHRVWDADRFLATRQDEARKLNKDAAAKGKPASAAVEQITHQQYLNERKVNP